MTRALSRSAFYLSSFLACGLMAVASGCASGGFKLTRQYAGWVNSQMIILRIVIYLLTGIVFAVTLLIDAVVFNTMDFWEGRVSQGDYLFQQGERVFHVKHEVLPEGGLRRSTIETKDLQGKTLEVTVVAENSNGEIELLVNGVKKATVNDLQALPMASIYNERGEVTRVENVLATMPIGSLLFARR